MAAPAPGAPPAAAAAAATCQLHIFCYYQEVIRSRGAQPYATYIFCSSFSSSLPGPRHELN